MGGPDAKVRTYRTSIPALSPVVLMDLSQLLWKVRQQTYKAIICTSDYVQSELMSSPILRNA